MFRSRGEKQLRKSCEKGHLAHVMALVHQDVDINSKDKEGNTALIYASRNGHVQVADFLIRMGAKIDIVNNCGSSALTEAARSGHVVSCSRLLSHSCNVDVQDERGASPLAIAAQLGNIGVAQLLLQAGAQPNLQTVGGDTPLRIAAYSGQEEMVGLLIACGADVDLANDQGVTPLITAAYQGYLRIVRRLVVSGADVWAMDHRGRNAISLAGNGFGGEARNEIQAYLQGAQQAREVVLLHESNQGADAVLEAARSGALQELQRLEQNGARLDFQDQYGRTALQYAATRGHIHLVQYLLSRNVPVDQADVAGKHPLIMAAAQSHVEVSRLLLAAGASVNQPMTNGATALIVASSKGATTVAQDLIRYGADLNAVDSQGWSAIFLAAAKNHPPAIRLLRSSGAAVDLPDVNGTTPIIIAAEKNHVYCVRALLEAGACIDWKTRHGASAVLVASFMGNKECVVELTQAGAQQLDVEGGRLAYKWAAMSEQCQDPDGKKREEIQQYIDQVNAASTLPDAARLGLLYRVQQLVAEGVSLDNGAGEEAKRIAQEHDQVKVVEYLQYIHESHLLMAAAYENDTFTIKRQLEKGVCEDVQLDIQPIHPYYAPLQRTAFPAIPGTRNAPPRHTNTPDTLRRTPTPVDDSADTDSPKSSTSGSDQTSVLTGIARNTCTPLLAASAGGALNSVKEIVSAGADLNKPDMFGVSPVAVAANEGQTDVIRWLIQRGGQVNPPEGGVIVPLACAALGGHVDVVVALCNAGCDMEARDEHGYTALMRAVCGGHQGVVEALAALGADMEARAPNGMTVFDMVAENGDVAPTWTCSDGTGMRACLQRIRDGHKITIEASMHGDTGRASLDGSNGDSNGESDDVVQLDASSDALQTDEEKDVVKDMPSPSAYPSGKAKFDSLNATTGKRPAVPRLNTVGISSVSDMPESSDSMATFRVMMPALNRPETRSPEMKDQLDSGTSTNTSESGSNTTSPSTTPGKAEPRTYTLDAAALRAKARAQIARVVGPSGLKLDSSPQDAAENDGNQGTSSSGGGTGTVSSESDSTGSEPSNNARFSGVTNGVGTEASVSDSCSSSRGAQEEPARPVQFNMSLYTDRRVEQQDGSVSSPHSAAESPKQFSEDMLFWAAPQQIFNKVVRLRKGGKRRSDSCSSSELSFQCCVDGAEGDQMLSDVNGMLADYEAPTDVLTQ